MEFIEAAKFPGWKQTKHVNQRQPAPEWMSHYKKSWLKGHPSSKKFNQCSLEYRIANSLRWSKCLMDGTGGVKKYNFKYQYITSSEMRMSQDDCDFGKC
jgi:hypothetical protein